MIWKNVQLFNVYETENTEEGVILHRFPLSAREAFKHSLSTFAVAVGDMTTGCEIRFVGKSADVFLSAAITEGSVEIYRGDFLQRVERLQVGEVKKIELRENSIDIYNPPCGRFSNDVWRIVSDHDFAIVLHDVQGDVRPPKKEELPEKTILAYGSSITHSAVAHLYSNSYIYNVARRLGADVLCKGMGGSCHIEKAVCDYLCAETFDVAILELGINMVGAFPVSVFEERARYLIKNMLTLGKPVVLISNFTCFFNFDMDSNHQNNEDYVACLEKLYQELKTDNLYYIKGQDIITDWEYLTCDLIHPSPFGHMEMGRKIAQIIHEEFKIL